MRSTKVILREVKRGNDSFEAVRRDGDLFGTRRSTLLGVIFGLCWALGATDESPVDRAINPKAETKDRKKRQPKA